MNASKKRSYSGALLAGLVILTKSTKVIAALKVLKFGKPLITLISMLVSAVLYGIWLGPWFGVGLVLMIFVHEMGHVIALRLKGMETPGPVFIPFLGAAIFVPAFKDRDTEAFVGYGGPLLGSIGALACFAAWYWTGQKSEILLLVSYVGIFINIFNLIPISPLDGGRITQAVGTWFKYIGLAILLAYTVFARQPSLLIIWVLVLDGFDGLTLWLRPAIAGFLGLMMAIFMALGYSGQPWWLDIFDCVLVSLFVVMFLSKDMVRSKKGEQEEVGDRPYPPQGIRMKWLAYYLGLAVLLSGVIVLQGQFLPDKVKGNTEQTTSTPTLIQ
ncbi:MAG: site-2 protease family protein [Candidatus Paceibacterota bacterium]